MKTPRIASRLGAVLILGALTLPKSAEAQVKRSRADVLFDEGKALIQAGDWPGGCAKFQASFDTDPAVSAMVKIARCREREGKLVASLAAYRRASELNRTLPQSPERKKELDALIADDLRALEPRIAKLSFRITPAPNDLEVSINGAVVPRAALAAPVEVDPGEPDVVVRAPGYREERLKPTVPEGVTHELVLGLVPTTSTVPAAVVAPIATPPPVAPTPTAPPPASDEPKSQKGSGQRTLGLVVGGAGIVALGVAGYFGIRTLVLVNEASPHCPDNVCDVEGYGMVDDANAAQTVGLVTGGIGVVLVATGITLYVTAPSEAQKATAAVRFGPSGATLVGTF